MSTKGKKKVYAGSIIVAHICDGETPDAFVSRLRSGVEKLVPERLRAGVELTFDRDQADIDVYYWEVMTERQIAAEEAEAEERRGREIARLKERLKELGG